MDRRKVAILFPTAGDDIAPTVVITSSESGTTSADPIPMTVTFSEEVAGFVIGDITAVNATLAAFATADNIVYTVNASATGAAVTIDVAAKVCKDLSGNDNAAAAQFAITYSAP